LHVTGPIRPDLPIREIVLRTQLHLDSLVFAAALAVLSPLSASSMPPPVGGVLPAEVREAAQAGLFDVPQRPALATSALQADWYVPVVLVSFQDSTLRYTPANFQFALFDTTHATATGSVPDYYQWASGGRLRMRARVIASVVLPNPENYYVNDSYGLNVLSTPRNDWGLVRDAIIQADPSVNWNEFDRDGDGFVDMLWIVHAGLGAELTGNRRNFYSNTSRLGFGWSGGGVIETADVMNGALTQKVRVDRFSVLPEISGFRPGSISEIGVFCHEFGHALGLPDLYDTSSLGGAANVGPGNWSLMSTGAYGGDGRTPEIPVHPGAWPSLFLGWASATRPANDTLATLTPTTNGGQILELWFQGESNSEHFLIEDRERTGFDRNLPDRGLVVYQVDDAMIGSRLGSNRINVGPTLGLRLLEGDGDGDLLVGRNRGDANDPLPGAGGVTRLDDGTSPSLRSISGAVTSLAIDAVELQAFGASARFHVRSPGWIDARDDGDAGLSLNPDPGRGHHAFVTPAGVEYEVFSDSRSGIAQIMLRSRTFEGDWAPPEPVSQSSGGAIQPTLASLSGDDLAIAWADRRAGTYQVWFRSRIGGIWTAERMLATSPLGCTAPTLAADRRGRVFAAWLDQGQNRPVLRFMAFQWSMPFGTASAVTDSLDSPSAPVLAASPEGHAWLLWPDRGTGTYAIKFARFAPDSGIGPKFRYSSNVVLQQAAVDVAVDTDGTAHVVWQQSSPGASEIHYMKRPASGAFSPRDTVLEGSSESLQNPAITLDQLAGLHVLFERTTPLGLQMRYRRFVPGQGWDFRSTDISDPLQGSVSRGSVLAVSHGGASVLYSAYDGYKYSQFSRRRRLDGHLAAGVPKGRFETVPLALGPNPLRPGQTLVVRGAALRPGTSVELFDAAGRRLAAVAADPAGGRAAFALEATGPLPAGLYFVRAGRNALARLVVVR
jgi:M6 family metalloprotease-like protein